MTGAFKQVESVFELGFQAKAHPYADLEAARNKFRLSVAQRVRYNEEQAAAAAAAKKRPAAQLDQPRSSVNNASSSISSSQASATKKMRSEENAVYHYDHPPEQQSVNGDLNGVISSSLNSVYGTEEVVYEQAQQTPQHYEPLGINLPPNFEQSARNHHEPWTGALCLEEPYEANKLFRYPKQLVYTGIPTEFSPEEIRARQWAGKIANIKEANQRREQYKARLKMEQDRRIEEERSRVELEEQQEQMRQEQIQQEQMRQEQIRQEQLLVQEQERQRAVAEYERQRLAEVERQRLIEAERQRAAAVEYQRQRELERKQVLLQQQQQQMEQERMRMEQENQRQMLVQQQQQQNHHHHHHHHNNHHQHYQHNGYSTTSTSVVNNTINLTSDDIEEQIEASTIRFSTGNGLSKPKTITIKFRKEKPATASGESVPLTPQPPPPESTVTPKSRKKSKVSKKNGGAYPGVQYHDNTYAAPTPAKANNIEEANLLLSIGQVHTSSNDGSAYSYSSGHPAQDSSSTYMQNDDSYSNSEFNATYPYSAENSNGNGPVANGGGSSSGYPAFSNTSTPIRASTSNYLSRVYSKSSSATPNAFKILTKRISNISYQNDDSMCSFSAAGESSFYAAEADEELKRKRTEKALATIQSHLAKPALDPFNMELCKAFLTKLGFPSREHDGTYKIMNTPIAKLSNAKSAILANIPFQIEKEVGRGSYGSVFKYVFRMNVILFCNIIIRLVLTNLWFHYRAVNGNTGTTVALKYQKPANNWELYICTEVRKKVTNPDVVCFAVKCQ